MKNKTLGIIMTIIGALIIVYSEFNYVTNDKAIDIGSIQFNKETSHPVKLSSTTIGAVLLVGGIVVFAVGKRSHKKNGYLK